MRTKTILTTMMFCVIPALAFAQSGEDLFKHQWVAGDSISPRGDGLGPVFNGTSCLQCHSQGGMGGGGSIDQNLDFLSNTNQQTRAKLRLIKAHTGFHGRDGLTKNTIILHRYSLDADYSRIRSGIIEFDGAMCTTDRERQRIQRAVSINPVRKVDLDQGVSVLRSQRNSTALFGAGLIDNVPEVEMAALATTHRPKFDMVSGRVSVLPRQNFGLDVRLGRFGWRGQTNSLEDFVTDACAFELGLELGNREQTPDPRNENYRPPGVDLTNDQVVSLRDFVASLPAPKQIMPTDKAMRKRIEHGNSVFHDVGCADCHIQSAYKIDDVYSDLLLHDMGTQLADPVLASTAFNPDLIARSLRFAKRNATLKAKLRGSGRANRIASGNAQPPGLFQGFVGDGSGSGGGGGGGSYGGGSRGNRSSPFPATATIETETSQEWRTAPLWGVADSAPYMHDGRSETLVEAIVSHGGEATDSVDAYFNSRIQDQLALVDFLKTLRSPQTDSRNASGK